MPNCHLARICLRHQVPIIKPALSALQTEQHFVNTQLLELLGKQNRSVLLGVLIVSAIITGIGLRSTTIAWWAGWWLLILVSLLVQYHLRTRRIPYGDPDATQAMLRKNIQMELFDGIGFALCLFSFPQLGDSEREIMTLIMVFVIIGGVPNTAGNRMVFWAFAGPITLALSASWIGFAGQNYSLLQGRIIGVLLLIPFVPMLHIFCNLSWQLFEESCRLRFRESDLNSRLTEALSRAEEANRAKTRFLAAASHDLRQPLHVIAFIASGLNMRNLDPKSQEMLRLMTKATDSLQALLDSLLDISRLDSGLMEPRLEEVAIDKLLNQLFLEVSPLITEKGLQPQFDLTPGQAAPETWTTHTDPALLLRILNNLLQNAIKYTKAGHVTLDATREGGHFIIHVSDSGVGVASEHHEEIFQEFYQVENHERDVKKGLGLGLAMVRRIANLLGIVITLDSVPGQGTRVGLSLPHRAIPVQSPPKESDVLPVQDALPNRPRHFPGLRILVVDDDVAVLRASELLFLELGCECHIAEDLAQARRQLAAMQPAQPDLIIADLRLRAQVSGIDVIRSLQAERRPGSLAIPAVLLTGDIAPERLLLAKRAGLRLCQKPLTLELLRDELAVASSLSGRSDSPVRGL